MPAPAIPFITYGEPAAAPSSASGDSLTAREARTRLPIVFAHANGYPPECYAPLLERLSASHPLWALYQRPLWPEARPQDVHNWYPLSADLLKFLEQRGACQVIAVGHSVGAIAILRAAMQEPQRFAALVLIEPVLMPPWVNLSWQVISALGLAERVHPLIKSASRRRQTFTDRETIFKSYRQKSVFRYLDDESLRKYIEGMVSSAPGGGWQLRYSVDWEVRIYATGVKADLDLWRALPGIKIPLLILRGAETDTAWASTARLVQLIRPATQVITLDHATHLAPLEKPAQVARLTLDFIRSHLL